MKKALLATALVALSAAAKAQSLSDAPGVYLGAEGGLNWLLNFTGYPPGPGAPVINVTPGTGWMAGGVIGYDFIGPRVELEGIYRWNPTNTFAPGTAINGQQGQLGIMANLYYDFMAGSTFTPYVGAGAGLGLVDGNSSLGSSVFAFQGILGVGWNVDSNFRINLDGRYYGTTSPTLSGVPWNNNNLSVMLSLEFKFGSAPQVSSTFHGDPSPPSFMVFFDWDRSTLSEQALSTIKQAAAAFQSRGNARITLVGHTDTSGPQAYNMALSLRRANAVKDALLREGLPPLAINVIGRGEQDLLVKTADGVREPQNRRVDIIIQ